VCDVKPARGACVVQCPDQKSILIRTLWIFDIFVMLIESDDEARLHQRVDGMRVLHLEMLDSSVDVARRRDCPALSSAWVLSF